MPDVNRSRMILSLACLLWSGVPTRAADMVAITITNNDTDDILVTVYDMNTNPHSRLLSRQLINGFASVPISVSADASGKGHVSWRATSASADGRQCGRKDKPGLAADASVHVYAHSPCP